MAHARARSFAFAVLVLHAQPPLLALARDYRAPDVWLNEANVSAACMAVPYGGNATVAFLGDMGSWGDCQNGCEAQPSCLSYCYMGKNSAHTGPGGRDWSGRCYGRSDNHWISPSNRDPSNTAADVYIGCDRTRVEGQGRQWCAPTFKNMTRGNNMQCVEVLPFVWPASKSATPTGCPLKQSALSLRFTGHGCSADKENSADTVYFTEGRDGTLFTGWADGHQGPVEVQCRGPQGRVGWSLFNGTSPRDLRLIDHGSVATPAGVGGELSGRYPVAGTSFNGVLYQGTYSEDNGENVHGRVAPQSCGGNTWCIGGPLVGWQHSSNRGQTWTLPNLNSSSNVFRQAWPSPPDPFQFKVMMAFWVDFGRNNERSPDGAHYLAAHGCNGTRGYNCTWTQGSHIYLLRIRHLSPETVNDHRQWEFFSGNSGNSGNGNSGNSGNSGSGNSGEPGTVGGTWSRDFRDLQPLVEWPNRCGPPAISWIGGATQRFVLVVGTPTVGLEMAPTLDTWVAESSGLTGPYKLVHYLSEFGNQGYNPNSPAKFWNNGLANATGWLWYSAMWKHIHGTDTARRAPLLTSGAHACVH